MDIIITDDILLKIAKDSRDIMFSDKYRDNINELYSSLIANETAEEMFNRLLNDEEYLKQWVFTKHFDETVLHTHLEYISNCHDYDYSPIPWEEYPDFRKQGYNEFESIILENSWLYEHSGVENIVKDYVDLINNGFRLIRERN